LELAFPLIVRPCLDAYVEFFLGALETYMASGFLHETKMEVDCFLGMMVFLGGG